MKVYVNCPECKVACVKILDKVLPTNRDMLFQCPTCKYVIPVRIYKAKTNRLW